MPTLTGVTYRTVTGSFRRFTGGPAVGTVSFQPSVRVVTSNNDIVVPDPIEATLDGNGDLSVSLPVNDDADVTPTGWTYLVIERIDGQHRSWSFALATGDGSPVDLADVAPTDPVSPATTYMLSSGGASQADIDTAVAAEAALRAAGDTDAKARANHTGTQLASTVSDFATAADARIVAVVVKSFIDALGVDAATLGGQTVAQITTAITAAIVDTAPGTLDTLNELAAALGDDPNFAATVTTALAGKQPLDADLTAIAALATTAYGRSLLTLANQAALASELSGTFEPVQTAASQAEMEAGTEAALRSMSPLRVAQAIDALSSGGTLPFVVAGDYGAVGDGVTDDSASLTAAIAALGTPGGEVRFAPGTYLCASSVTVPTNVYLVGQGRSTDSGSAWAATDVTIRGSGALTQVLLISGTNSGLIDIQVDGADAATSAVRVTGSDNRIAGCAIKRGTSYALKLDSGGNRNNIIDCIIRNSSTTPVGTPLQVDSIDNLIIGCRVLSGVTSIVTIGTANQLVGCHISANTTTLATVIFGNRCLIEGNIIDGGAAGPHLKTTVGGALVIGNQIYNLGLTDNTYPAIDDQGANAITNYLSNRIEGQGASNRFSYGISVGTNAKPIFIGNSVLNAVALWDTRPIVAMGNVRKLSGVYYYDEPYEALVSRTGAATGDVPTLQGDGTLAFDTPATNLSYTAAPGNGTVTSDTGTDATVPLADGTNAGLLAPAGFTKLGHLTVTQAVDLDTIEARVNSLDAAVVLRGNWDASAGTFPGGGTAQAGDSYIVTTGGTVDSVVFAVGDRIVAILDNASTGTYAANWLKLDYTDQVLSVAGQTGAVTLAKGDVGLGNADNTSDANKPVSTAQQTALDAKVPLDLSSLTASTVPDSDDLVYIWLDGAARKVALSDLIALVLASPTLTGTVTIPDGALAIADTNGLQAALDAKAALAGAQFTGAVKEAVVALTDGANIATDASLGNVFKVTLGGNRTMDNPTNPVAGQKIIYRITQDGTGTRTLAWGTAFRFSTDVPSPTLTTTASKSDYVGFIYNGDASKWDCLAVNKGF